jgi:hypothetical protein
MVTTMPDWLSTLVAVSGSGSLVGIAIAAVMRSLPYLAKARDTNAQAQLARMQTRQANAEARRAEAEARAAESVERRRNDEVTATQVTAWMDEMKARIRDLQQRLEEQERRAEECEKRNRVMAAELEELRRSIGRRDWTDPPPLPIPEETSSARIEIVQRSNGDNR